MRTRAAASLGGARGQAAWRGAGEGDFGPEAAAAHGMGGNEAFNSGRGSAAWDSRSRGDAGPGRGGRRAAHAGGYGAGGYGPGDYGDYGSPTASGRTAVRQGTGDFRNEPDWSTRGQRSRIAERQFTRGGGNGRGGGGHGGGRSYGGGPHGRGGGFTNWLLYGSWWRHWTLKKALAVVGGTIAACFLLGIAVFFILYKMTPIPTARALTANWQSSSVYFADGKQMGTYDTSIGGVTIDRMLLTPAQIPNVMTQAMTAAEDRHFYSEGGVSFTGLLRAAYEDVLGNGNLQGGSTITMQYAKNYYAGVNSGQNLSTKLKEIFIAMKLGHEKSKQWVMTNYLNTVPFGATIDGLGAAAQSYFNINLTQPGKKLTLAQAALLASMPNNPAVFSSVVLAPHPSKAAGYSALVARFNYVLGNMVRDGQISAATAKATKFPTINPPASGNGETGVTGYLMNMVEQQLEAPKAVGGYNLTQQQIDTGGYKIRTTFSMAKVNALARSVQAEKAQMKALGVRFPGYDRVGAVLENSKTGAIVAIYGGPGYLSDQKRCNVSSCDINMAESAQQVGSSFKPYVLSAAVNANMDVFASKLNGFSPIWIPLSSVGGTSSEQALSPTSPPPGCSRQARNGSVCFSNNGAHYYVFNESTENLGKPIPVNMAAAVSSDPAFEDLAHRDGIDNVINMAQAFGVGQTAFVAPCSASAGADSVAETIKACNDLTGPDNGLIPNFSPTRASKRGQQNGTPGSPAIALGENPLTPIEQASTFATLADDGVYHTPHVISSVQQSGTTLKSNLTTRRVLSASAAADVDWALSFDNNYQGGTAEATVPFRRGDVIGKTGTLGVNATASQAWFLGGTPNGYAMSVALFTNLPGKQNLNNLPGLPGPTPGSQGGAWPASIWQNMMQRAFSNSPYVPLTTFPQVHGYPFVPWIQVHAQPPKQFCQPSFGGNQGNGNQGCTCPKHSPWCGNNPNPQPPCNGNGNGNGGNCTSPNPSPSCQFGVFGSQCSSSPPTSTPPTTTPPPTTSPPTPTCSSGPPGQCHTTAGLTSYIRSSPGSGSPPGSAASVTVLAAEDAATRLAALLGLVI
jgi:membrane peptidoglycan carboxypeptidase